MKIQNTYYIMRNTSICLLRRNSVPALDRSVPYRLNFYILFLSIHKKQRKMTTSFVSVQDTVYCLSNFNEITRKMPPDCQRNLDSYLSPVTLLYVEKISAIIVF